MNSEIKSDNFNFLLKQYKEAKTFIMFLGLLLLILMLFSCASDKSKKRHASTTRVCDSSDEGNSFQCNGDSIYTYKVKGRKDGNNKVVKISTYSVRDLQKKKLFQ